MNSRPSMGTRYRLRRITRFAPALVAACVVALAGSGPAHGFTQSGFGIRTGNGIPMGHEWITRLAALEVVGDDPVMSPDSADPRRRWTKGLAKNTDLSSLAAQAEVARIKSNLYMDQRYASAYKAVYDAIVGERWVDIAGVNVSAAHADRVNCWDAVAQEPAEVQYDHFMRRYDDQGGQGGVNAAKRSTERFVTYFVDAAMAPRTLMRVWDGGAYAALTDVDRNYFLMGRAAHLLQDSFSPEHTVRLPIDNYERVRQVKSYLCAAGSELHTHSQADLLTYQSGDVIWKPGTQLSVGWPSYKPSNMKDSALVAVEATKDLWAAFIRTMSEPYVQRRVVAEKEARKIANNWLQINEGEALGWYANPSRRDDTYVLAAGEFGKGRSVSACMRSLGVASGNQMERVRELEVAQRRCLYNVKAEQGYDDLFDTSLHMPFNWAWKNPVQWLTPPADWKVPDRPADTGVRVSIKSVYNGQFMTADWGGWVYCRPGTPLKFIRVGDETNAIFRLTNANLFLSYHALSGAVGLYGSPEGASYRIDHLGNSQTILNTYWQQYMWLFKASPYITGAGNPHSTDAQWKIEGVPVD